MRIISTLLDEAYGWERREMELRSGPDLRKEIPKSNVGYLWVTPTPSVWVLDLIYFYLSLLSIPTSGKTKESKSAP